MSQPLIANQWHNYSFCTDTTKDLESTTVHIQPSTPVSVHRNWSPQTCACSEISTSACRLLGTELFLCGDPHLEELYTRKYQQDNICWGFQKTKHFKLICNKAQESIWMLLLLSSFMHSVWFVCLFLLVCEASIGPLKGSLPIQVITFIAVVVIVWILSYTFTLRRVLSMRCLCLFGSLWWKYWKKY